MEEQEQEEGGREAWKEGGMEGGRSLTLSGGKTKRSCFSSGRTTIDGEGGREGGRKREGGKEERRAREETEAADTRKKQHCSRSHLFLLSSLGGRTSFPPARWSSSTLQVRPTHPSLPCITCLSTPASPPFFPSPLPQARTGRVCASRPSCL